jgi:hypothetical protein
MMKKQWCDMPIVTCPHCGKEFQLDDYYDYKTDDSFECYKCEKPIYIHTVDMIITYELATEPHPSN